MPWRISDSSRSPVVVVAVAVAAVVVAAADPLHVDQPSPAGIRWVHTLVDYWTRLAALERSHPYLPTAGFHELLLANSCTWTLFCFAPISFRHQLQMIRHHSPTNGLQTDLSSLVHQEWYS